MRGFHKRAQFLLLGGADTYTGLGESRGELDHEFAELAAFLHQPQPSKVAHWLVIGFARNIQHSVNDLVVVPLCAELCFPLAARAVAVATACLVTVKDVRPSVPGQLDVRYRKAIRCMATLGYSQRGRARSATSAA